MTELNHMTRDDEDDEDDEEDEDDEGGEEGEGGGDEPEDDIEDEEDNEGATIFRAGANSAAVAAQNLANPDSDITSVHEFRSKLRFRGNKVVLKNPQLVPGIITNIKQKQ